MTLCLRRRDLHWRDLSDEIVVLDGQKSVYLAVQGSGAKLWRLLSDCTTRDSLIETLVRTYGIDAKRAGDDVDAFLATLSDRGLLSI